MAFNFMHGFGAVTKKKKEVLIQNSELAPSNMPFGPY